MHATVASAMLSQWNCSMAAQFPMDKVPPTQIAEEALRAVEDGTEDVFPDDVARGIYQQFRADPKASEYQIAEQAPAS